MTLATTGKLADLGYRPIKDAPEQFAEYLNTDIKTISEIIAQSGIEPQMATAVNRQFSKIADALECLTIPRIGA